MRRLSPLLDVDLSGTDTCSLFLQRKLAVLGAVRAVLMQVFAECLKQIDLLGVLRRVVI